jgi:hypothetical protein
MIYFAFILYSIFTNKKSVCKTLLKNQEQDGGPRVTIAPQQATRMLHKGWTGSFLQTAAPSITTSMGAATKESTKN